MVKPIDQIGLNKLRLTLKSLAKAGGTTYHADWIRSSKDNAARLIESLDYMSIYKAPEMNRYEMTVEDQLKALRRANDEEQWGIGKEVFARLAKTAPAWPEGRYAYRSLRIRFGKGNDGVVKTFEAHCTRIQRVFGKGRSMLCVDLRSGKVKDQGTPVKRLELLSGNHTHQACVKWILADLDANWKELYRTPGRNAKPLADELLVIAWMFPKSIRDDLGDYVWLCAGGYVLIDPESDEEESRRGITVEYRHSSRMVSVQDCAFSVSDSDYAVPFLL